MASLRDLDPHAAPIFSAFLRWLSRAGVRARLTSTRRSFAKQTQLYAAYRAGRSRFPAAPPGHSTHALGIAVDLVLDPPVYAWAGAAWKRAGFTWGGDFSDPIHFDLRRHA